MKQDESNNDLKFTMSIGFGGKSSSHWTRNKRQFWKWTGICGNCKSPISKFDVGQTNSKNKRKTCKAQLFLPRKLVRCEVWINGL